MVWLYISIIMLMRVVQSIFSKKASLSVPQKPEGYLSYSLYYLSLAGAFAAVLFAIDALHGAEIAHIGATALYASLSGVALAIGCLCSLYALSKGTMALNSLFATGGLIVPAILGIFMFGEVLSVWQWVGLAVFMVGAYLLAISSKKTYGSFSLKTLLVLLLSLTVNGATMLFQKMFGMNVEGGNVSLFSLISFASGATVLAVSLMIVKIRAAVRPDKVEREKFPKRLFLFGLALAFAVFVINQFATLSTPLISAVTLFSIINGGATLVDAIVGAVAYREKLTVRAYIGLALGIGALILIKL